MSIVRLNPIETKDWNHMILRTGQYSIFHSREWARVLINSFNYSPNYLTLIADNKISLLIPLLEINSALTGRRAVSLPFSDFCDPILSEETDTDALIEFLVDYANRFHWKYIDFHGGADLFKNRSPSQTFYGHRLELTKNIETTFSAFRSNTRRNIKKAIRSNVKIYFCNSLEYLDQFYRLHCLTRKRHRIPVQSYDFFRNIYNEIIKKELGILLCASYQGIIFSAAVFFHFGNHALFKFGVSDYRYQHLRGNNLLMWEAIKWYSRRGYKTFSLGRTDIQHDGLNRYKTGWGGSEYQMKYFRYDMGKGQIVKIKSAKRDSIMKFSFHYMPTGLSKILGRILYRHFA